MADPLKSKITVQEFRNQYFLENRQAEENRSRETEAAVAIQSWFRGCKVRAYLRHLHNKVVIIQKVFRGFRARTRARQMVKEAYFIMKMNFYNAMAVRIQCHWRGYYVRKYVHNFYARKHDLEKLDIHERRAAILKEERVALPFDHSLLIPKELAKINDLGKRQSKYVEIIKEQTSKITQAQHLHYLLSTKQSPGVFNSPFRPAPHEMELMLQQVNSNRQPPRERLCSLIDPETEVPGTDGTSAFPRSKGNHSSKPILPPIYSDKPQITKSDIKQLTEPRDHSPLCPNMASLHASCAHLDEIQNHLLHHQKTKLPNIVRDTGNVFENIIRGSYPLK